jgi:hypothetical protein
MEDMTYNSGNDDAGFVKKQFLTMKLFFFSVQVSPLIFLAVVIFAVKSGSLELSEADRVRHFFLFFPYVFMTVGLMVSIVVRARAGRIMGVGENFLEGLKRYFGPMVISLAACDSAAIVCGISVLFGNEIDTIIIPFVISMAAKWLHFPGRERLAEAYEDGRRRYLEEQRPGV